MGNGWQVRRITLSEEIELIKHFFLSSDVRSVLQGIHIPAVFLRHQRNNNISARAERHNSGIIIIVGVLTPYILALCTLPYPMVMV